MDLPAKKPYQWRNEYPTKKPRIRQELVGEIHPAILPPSLAGIVTPGAKPVVFTVKVWLFSLIYQYSVYHPTTTLIPKKLVSWSFPQI